MQYKLPDYIKRQCLAIAQGYEENRRYYLSERQMILNSSSSGHTNYIDSGGVECRQYNSHVSGRISNEPHDKTIQLEQLEKHIKVKQYKAVDDAKFQIGIGFPEHLRQKLTKAIMINCSQPRRYPYGRLDVGDMERSTFYNHRSIFLYNIAISLQFV